MKHLLPFRATCCALACAVLGACSAQQLYATGQQWQRNECLKIDDRAERQRCEQSHATSYEAYQAQAASLKKP